MNLLFSRVRRRFEENASSSASSRGTTSDALDGVEMVRFVGGGFSTSNLVRASSPAVQRRCKGQTDQRRYRLGLEGFI